MRIFQQKGCKTYRVRFSINGLEYDKALGTRDKEVAYDKARILTRETEREIAGILEPKLQRDVANTPLSDLLAEWIEIGLAQATSAKHVKNCRNRTTRLFQECGWRFVKDIDSCDFDRWRLQKRGEDLKPKTLNAYLEHVRTFLNWMVKRRMILFNPLDPIEKLEVAETDRRCLSIDELSRLIAAADHYRALVYTAAAFSGLRRSELWGLEWPEIDLDSETPMFRLDPAKTKNRKGGYLPIHPDALAALRELRELCKSPKRRIQNERVFYRGIPKMPRFLKDLELAKIPEFDERGRRMDFHGLRATWITFLTSSSLPPAVIVELARHADPRLTFKTYTDAFNLPVLEAVEKMPSLQSSPRSSPKTGKSCPNVSTSGEMGVNENDSETSVTRSESEGLDGVVHPCPQGQKTEGVGFEPTVPCGTLVFKTSAFDHSATPPNWVCGSGNS